MSRLVCGLADQPLQRFGSVHSVINQLHQPKVPGGLSGTLTLGRVLVETLSLQNAYDFIYTGKFADLTSPARFALREKERKWEKGVKCHFRLHFYSNVRLIPKSFYAFCSLKTKETKKEKCVARVCAVHGVLQARTLEWGAFPFSRGSSQPRN